jgi:hypothetical protein
VKSYIIHERSSQDLNGTHQLLVYVDVNIDTIKKNTETLIDASKEVGLEVNAEKTKYMLLSPHENAVQNHDIKIVKKFCENVSHQIFGNASNKSKSYSGGNKRRLNSGNACYSSLQNIFLLSCLLYKK